MKDEEKQTNTNKIDVFYRERWDEAADAQMDERIKDRIYRAIVRYAGLDAKRFTINTFMRYAAAVAIGISIGFGTYFMLGRRISGQDNANAPANFVVTADNGQRSGVTLPDGTEVYLNSHSTISYSSDYGVEERSVNLTGEAFFDVAKDADKRFLVHAGGAVVEALGTSFNIKAYSEDDEIVTTLLEGSVVMTVNDLHVELAPNQTAMYDKNSLQLSTKQTDNDYAVLWRNNELAFEGRTLEEIASLFNRSYNITIQFETEKIKKYRFSGVIKNNSLDNVFEIISLTAPISFRYSGDTIILSEQK